MATESGTTPPKNLRDLARRYSHVRFADESDNEDILIFLTEQKMKSGALVLDFDRGEDFFGFCRLHSDNYFAFLFLNDDGSIGGVGTLLRKKRWAGGKLVPVGYLCDLRISPHASRKTHVQWRKFYADVVAYLPNGIEDERCDELFTAIFNENEAALRSLTQKLRNVNYKSKGHYSSYVLFGRKWRKPNPKNYALTTPTDAEVSKFMNFQLAHLDWSPAFSEESPEENELLFRSQQWQDWNAYPWIGIKDSHGLLVACGKLWHDPQYRRIKVEKAPRLLRYLTRALVLLRKPIPKLGESLVTASVVFFEVHRDLEEREKLRCGQMLLNALYEQSKDRKYHFIQWSPSQANEALAKTLTRSFFHSRKGGFLFKVEKAQEKNLTRPEERRSDFYFETTL